MKNSICVIFGGSGFIGSHLAKLLIEKKYCSQVILADIVEPDLNRFGYFMTELIENSQIRHKLCDVRDIASFDSLPTLGIQLIVNLAAIHREPGHKSREYFETNISGAENACAWAETVACTRVIFTSSISSYGSCGEEVKSELSIPCPETAYGSSKLEAEKIHLCWQKNNPVNKLIIVRPGVVFGPGEGGNVTRLVQAVIGRYFFYMGNKKTVKAGIYVKELCYSLLWFLDEIEKKENKCLLYNASMLPAPSIEEYVFNICKAANIKRNILSVPYSLLYCTAFLMDMCAKPLGISHSFSPIRIKKLVRSNSVYAKILKDMGYNYHFSLESALKDWKSDTPDLWK